MFCHIAPKLRVLIISPLFRWPKLVCHYNPALAKEYNDTLREMKDDGTFDKIAAGEV